MAFVAPTPDTYFNSTNAGAYGRRRSSVQSDFARRYNLADRGTSYNSEELCGRFDFENGGSARFDGSGEPATSKGKGTKVIVKRVSSEDTSGTNNANREIAALSRVMDDSLPFLVDWLQLEHETWTVFEHRPCQSLTQIIESQGPFPESRTKTAFNQVLSGLVALFLAEFAHLRICSDTVYLDEHDQIVIKDFQFVGEYGKEKIDDLYSPIEEKYGSDIYVAPEVFANRIYNARKAVMWSTGVLLYYMTTGQTAKLSNLDHPAFESLKSQQQYAQVDTTAPPPPPTHHRRKSSIAAVQAKLILYPSRFAVPNYARVVIPKMLTEQPMRRAELIEVASRIPKDYVEKHSTRPLMELAWLDYKNHVGPYANLHIPDPDLKFSDDAASSIYSAVSALSNPFQSLLGKVGGGRRKSSVDASRYGYGR